MEVKVVRQILEWNDNCHNELVKEFDEKKTLVLNIMGSPGAGKTTFIKMLIEKLNHKYTFAVIEGDVAGTIDAEIISSMGVPVVQLNTDGACHIEAMSIKNIIPEFDLAKTDILIVENIGNLVCPAEFDIGEHLKFAILSIPEGDDKVEKYPLLFSRSDVLVLTKHDLKEVFEFDDDRVVRESKKLNQNLEIYKVNSREGSGFENVISFIVNNIERRFK